LSKKYRDEDWLREQYWEKKKTQTEMAKMVNCSIQTISRWMEIKGVDTRDRRLIYITHDEYVDRIKDRPLEILEKFHGISEKALHRCLKCGHEWKVVPNNIVNVGTGCPKCSQERVNKKQTKTHDQYLEEISHRSITPTEKYDGSNTNIKHKCNECGHEWTPTPSMILRGNGCPECSRREKTKSHNQYIKELSERPIKPLEEYVNNKTKIKHECLECGYKWKVAPKYIVEGQGCPECVRREQNITHEEYVQRIKGRPIKALEKYKNSTTKIKHKCEDCGYEWEVVPHNIMANHGCPKCAQSHGEKRIDCILNRQGVNFVRETGLEGCNNSHPLKFDFIITQDKLTQGSKMLKPTQANAAIEFDGRQHFKPVEAFGGEEGFKVRVKRDKIKDEFCSDNDIPLLRVTYKDRDNNRIEDKVLGFLEG